jgi:hypothetical protein
MDQCAESFCDFRTYFYPMGETIFSEKTPVLGYYYSPFFAILLGFFGMFPLESAVTMWVVVEVIAAVCIFVLSYRLAFHDNWDYAALWMLIFLLSFPVLHCFKWGQVGILVVAILLASIVLWKNGHALLAIVLIAIAASIKYYLIIFFLIPLLKKEYRVFLWGVVSLVAIFLIVPVSVLGVHETLEFYRILRLEVAKQVVRLDGVNSQYVVSIIMRHGLWSLPIAQKLEFFFIFAGFGIVFLNLFILSKVVSENLQDKEAWAMVLLSVSTVFFVATSWPHTLVYLPFCQLFFFRQIIIQNGTNSSKWLKIGLLLVPSIALSSILWFAAVGDWQSYGKSGYLFWSNFFLLILTYLQLSGRSFVRTSAIQSNLKA